MTPMFAALSSRGVVSGASRRDPLDSEALGSGPDAACRVVSVRAVDQRPILCTAVHLVCTWATEAIGSVRHTAFYRDLFGWAIGASIA